MEPHQRLEIDSNKLDSIVLERSLLMRSVNQYNAELREMLGIDKSKELIIMTGQVWLVDNGKLYFYDGEEYVEQDACIRCRRSNQTHVVFDLWDCNLTSDSGCDAVLVLWAKCHRPPYERHGFERIVHTSDGQKRVAGSKLLESLGHEGETIEIVEMSHWKWQLNVQAHGPSPDEREVSLYIEIANVGNNCIGTVELVIKEGPDKYVLLRTMSGHTIYKLKVNNELKCEI